MYLIDYNRVIRINIINDFDFMCCTCTLEMRDNMFSCHSGLNKISISLVEKKVDLIVFHMKEHSSKSKADKSLLGHVFVCLPE